jgi:hypothetical protein
MVNRFYENTPQDIKPQKSISNTKELVFNLLDSGYRVSTAGASGTGRSDTVHYFHGSEVAFWEKAEMHAAGVLQAAKAAEEIILESTANGMSGWFREQWVKAVSGESDFLAVFFPWFIEAKYRKPVPEGFVLTEEEEDYKARYELDDEQMCWRRSTEIELGSKELFKQEYPANAEEAFQFSPVKSYIEPELVIDAMNRPQTLQGEHVAIIAAFDPSQKGRDRDVFGLRQGSNIFGIEIPKFGEDHESRINYLKRKLDGKVVKIDKLFVDWGGGGNIIASRLKEDGYMNVRAIEFGAAADDKSKAKLKRTEMQVCFREALIDKYEPVSIKVDEDIKNEVLRDLTAAGYKRDEHGRPMLETKEQMKSRGVRSTDIADMIGLLYAQPVKGKGTKRTVTAINDYDYYEV